MLISFSTLPTMQKYLYGASEELSGHGLDVWTVGSSTLNFPARLSDRNLLVDTPSSPKPSPQSLLSSKAALDNTISLIERAEPDVVHFVNKHVWNFLLLLRYRSRRRLVNPKWVHTFHDPVGHHGDSVQRGVIAYHRVMQRRLDAVIVHSEVSLNQTLGILKPKCRVERVPLGLKPWPGYPAFDPKCLKRILIFGRLNLYKGCAMYPEIFHEINRLDPGVKITVAGQASADLPEGLIDSIAACPNVSLENRFVEESEVAQYFRESALVLTPYTSMTQSGVILDAFSFGRPILPFRIEGMSEFLPPDAVTVEAFDTFEYARMAVNIVNSPDIYVRAGSDAWEFGARKFSLNAMAAGFSRVYQGIAGSRVEPLDVRNLDN